MEDEARELVDALELTAHPEGGYYRRTYESPVEVPSRSLPEGYASSRRLGSAILYLLPASQVSRLHRLRGDEMWHFYRGTSLDLHVFGGENGYRRVRLGKDPLDDETPQELVRGHGRGGVRAGRLHGLTGVPVRGLRTGRSEFDDRSVSGTEVPDPETYRGIGRLEVAGASFTSGRGEGIGSPTPRCRRLICFYLSQGKKL